jgi:hypothetical protein
MVFFWHIYLAKNHASKENVTDSTAQLLILSYVYIIFRFLGLEMHFGYHSVCHFAAALRACAIRKVVYYHNRHELHSEPAGSHDSRMVC